MASIGVVQYGICPLKSKAQFWARVNLHVQKAQAREVKLLVFPEYMTAHLLALVPAMDHPDACAYLNQHTDEYLSTFTRLSKETKLTILGGTHILREGTGYVNAAFLFFPDGRVEMQKKVHLTPEERNTWGLTPGNSFAVYDTQLGRAAVLICYDIEFPEGGRIVADLGAEIILCPSYTDAPAGYYRVRHCCQARAIENQLYVALSGIVGKLPQVPQIDAGYSQAAIFAPCDHPFPAHGIIAAGRTNQNALITCEFDPGLLKANREQGQVAPFSDRRPEIYTRYKG